MYSPILHPFRRTHGARRDSRRYRGRSESPNQLRRRSAGSVVRLDRAMTQNVISPGLSNFSPRFRKDFAIGEESNDADEVTVGHAGARKACSNAANFSSCTRRPRQNMCGYHVALPLHPASKSTRAECSNLVESPTPRTKSRGDTRDRCIKFAAHPQYGDRFCRSACAFTVGEDS